MDRNSFILHKDSLCVLDDMTQIDRGELFYAIYKWQLGEEIELSPLVKIAFSQFKNQFARDNLKYNQTVEKRKQAGAKGGKQKLANASKCKQKLANVADSDNKSVNDSDNDSKNNNKKNNVNEIIYYFNSKTNRKIEGDKNLISDIEKVLKNYSIDDCKKVIDFIISDKWYKEQNQDHLSVIFRPTKFIEKLERANNINLAPKNINDTLFNCNQQNFDEAPF